MRPGTVFRGNLVFFLLFIVFLFMLSSTFSSFLGLTGFIIQEDIGTFDVVKAAVGLTLTLALLIALVIQLRARKVS